MHRRVKEDKLKEFTEHQLVCAIYDLFTAGMETTAVSCYTFILYLINYPEFQAKIHKEIDSVVGRENVGFFIYSRGTISLTYLSL